MVDLKFQKVATDIATNLIITKISTLKFQGYQMHQVVSEVTLYHVIVKAQLAGIYDCKPTESEDRAEGQG